MKKTNEIKIKEEVQIGNIILEKGDRIKVINEKVSELPREAKAVEDAYLYFKKVAASDEDNEDAEDIAMACGVEIASWLVDIFDDIGATDEEYFMEGFTSVIND